VALVVDSNDKVDEVYRKAIALGAQDEGPPGPRGLPGFYAAYFRDLDGHKLNCFCWKPA
ncbi:MAG TPA: VOC family protein, partial [Rhodospirillales bacterium]|nr:VOC family protein [Rhodospirillales bacterium]